MIRGGRGGGERKSASGKSKQYPILFDKQLKGYREKDVRTNTPNAVAKEIEIGRFLLFSRKNN